MILPNEFLARIPGDFAEFVVGVEDLALGVGNGGNGVMI